MKRPTHASTGAGWSRALLALAGALLMLPAQAQESSAGAERGSSAALEEIIVSARKREEALLEVPIAITAFSAEQLEKAQVFDMRELTKLSPGMTFQSVGGNGPGGRFNSNLIFRGMTNSAPLPRQQTGAVFVDGVYVLGGIASVNTVDVERVEVLKGPQSAYFGRNTFGGAVNFITRNPGQEFRGQVAAELDDWGSNSTSLSLEGPLIADKLSGRISVLSFDKAGQYTATDGGVLGNESTLSVTGTLYATPTDRLSARLRVHYQEDDDGPTTSAQLSGAQNGNSCAGRTYQGRNNDGTPRTFSVTLPYFCSGVPTLSQLGEGIVSSNTSLVSSRLAGAGVPNLLRDAFVGNSLNDPLLADAPSLDEFGLKRELLRVSAQVQYEFANGSTAALNLGSNRNDSNAIADPDRGDVENVYTATPALFEDRAIELRLTSPQDKRLRWLVGANYYDGEFRANFNGSVIWQVPTIAPMAPPFFPTVASRNAPANRDGEEATVQALFGSIDFDITDQLTATAEIRWQKDEATLGVPVDPGRPQPAKAEFTDTMPRFIVKYQPNPSTNIYLSWSKGVLPGQFNAQYISATDFQRQQIQAQFPGVSERAPSQELESLELGIKQRLFNDRLEYSLAIYDMEWTKMLSGSALVIQTSPTNPAPLILTGVLIPGDSKLRGVEFEGTALLTDAWDVNLRLDVMDTEYTTFFQPFVSQLTGGTIRWDGNTLPRVPQSSASLSSTYRGTAGDTWNWYLRGDLTYTGKAWDSEANIVETDDYTRVNLRFGLERDGLLVELFAKNLFNDKNWDYAFRSVSFKEPGGGLLTPLPPASGATIGFQQGMIVQPPDKRSIGLRVRYQF